MSMGKVKLKTLISKAVSGEWGEGEGEINVLRTTNFNNDGSIDYSEVVKRDIPEKKIFQKALMFGDTIIEKSGGSPKQPVGRVVFFDKKSDVFLCNNFTSALRPNPDTDAKYVFWYLFDNHLTGKTLKYQNKTTGIINLQLERYLNDLEIPLPPLTIQKQIAEILDNADALRKKDLELLNHYDALAQSLFIDMFGDPVKNEKGWEVKKLGKISSKILSGNTPKGGSEVYVNEGINFFRSQNVWKNELVYEDIAYLDEATHAKMKNSSLMYKDILMTKTGRINTESSSLGRAALFLGNDNSANVNGHVYLIRLKQGNIHEFVLKILTSIEYRDHIRNVCVGGIDKRQLNKEHIKDFPIIYPPISLQNQFAIQIQNIEIQKEKVKAQIEASENLFQTLLQKAFHGSLED